MDIHMLSDEDLVKHIREQNKEDYEEILNRYQDKIFAYVFRLINNWEEARDITQNAFIKTYKNLNNFDVDKKFSSWLYRIAHNESVNHIKRVSLIKMVAFDTVEFMLMSDKGELEDRVDKKLIRSKIEKYLQEIDFKYRDPIVLYYFEDKSHKEISEILRLPVSTVGTLISRGRKKLEAVHN